MVLPWYSVSILDLFRLTSAYASWHTTHNILIRELMRCLTILSMRKKMFQKNLAQGKD